MQIENMYTYYVKFISSNHFSFITIEKLRIFFINSLAYPKLTYFLGHFFFIFRPIHSFISQIYVTSFKVVAMTFLSSAFEH